MSGRESVVAIHPTAEEFGDPCPGTFKGLQVQAIPVASVPAIVTQGAGVDKVTF